MKINVMISASADNIILWCSPNPSPPVCVWSSG